MWIFNIAIQNRTILHIAMAKQDQVLSCFPEPLAWIHGSHYHMAFLHMALAKRTTVILFAGPVGLGLGSHYMALGFISLCKNGLL